MEVLGLVSSRWKKACHALALGAGSRPILSSFLHVLHQPVALNSEEPSNPNGLVLWVAKEGIPSPSSPQLSWLVCPQPVTQLPAGLLVEASSLRVCE